MIVPVKISADNAFTSGATPAQLPVGADDERGSFDGLPLPSGHHLRPARPY